MSTFPFGDGIKSEVSTPVSNEIECTTARSEASDCV
jgi:hypothetical protein